MSIQFDFCSSEREVVTVHGHSHVRHGVVQFQWRWSVSSVPIRHHLSHVVVLSPTPPFSCRQSGVSPMSTEFLPQFDRFFFVCAVSCGETYVPHVHKHELHIKFSLASSGSARTCDACEQGLLRLERGHRGVQIISRTLVRRLEFASHEWTSHELVTFCILCHAVDPLRRGRNLSCPGRCLSPRAAFEHLQRVNHAIHFVGSLSPPTRGPAVPHPRLCGPPLPSQPLAL